MGMSNFDNEIKLRATAQAKIEMDIEAFEKAGGVPTIELMEYSVTRTMTQSKQAKVSYQHNTAKKDYSV